MFIQLDRKRQEMGTVQQKINLQKVVKQRYNAQTRKLDLWKILPQDSIIILTTHDFTNIKTLHLYQNKAVHLMAQKVFDRQYPELEEILLKQGQLNDQAFKLILRKCQKLTKINVQFNHLTQKTVLYIAQHNFHIKSLDLKYNHINMMCLNYQQIIPNLKNNQLNLKFLNLNDNCIGAKGCYFLSRLQLFSLQHFQISNCHIGNSGLINLSKGIFESLKRINLCKNQIGQDGLQKYIIFSNVVNIQYIFLTFNKINYIDVFMLFTSQWKRLYSMSTLKSLINDHFRLSKMIKECQTILVTKFKN